MGKLVKTWYYDLRTSHYLTKHDKAVVREKKARDDKAKYLGLAKHYLTRMEDVINS